MKPGYGGTWVLREDPPSRYSGQFPSPFPPHAALPTKPWETPTSNTLSQTAITIQSPSKLRWWGGGGGRLERMANGQRGRVGGRFGPRAARSEHQAEAWQRDQETAD